MSEAGTPLLACGHAANSHAPDGEPCCAICFGLNEGATTVVECPDLSGRAAQCESCGKVVPSRLTLPFFQVHDGRERDSFYCGCRGWD